MIKSKEHLEYVNSLQSDTVKTFRDQQQKYAYYIIALCVAAIGFSVQKTYGLPLKWSQLPLALAILCWSTSILCGLKFLQYVISSLYAHHVYYDVIKGADPEVGKHPSLIEAASSGVMKAVQKNSRRAMRYATGQDVLFLLGVLSFLVWHIFEMYLAAIIK